jgi:hypothetical protein
MVKGLKKKAREPALMSDDVGHDLTFAELVFYPVPPKSASLRRSTPSSPLSWIARQCGRDAPSVLGAVAALSLGCVPTRLAGPVRVVPLMSTVLTLLFA